MQNLIKAIIIFILLTNTSLANAIYPVQVLSVYDGDTFNVKIEIWADISIETTVRIAGIDTPESRTKCKAEKKLAKYAKRQLQRYLEQGATITNIRHGKYAGRIIADVTLIGDRDLAQLMIKDGHARSYDGGYKPKWCYQE